MNKEVQKRGRPRIHITDANGETEESDLRVRVRLAQRAYRSRRLAREESSRQQADRTMHAIRAMHQAWSSFRDSAVEQGVTFAMPGVGRDLALTDTVINDLLESLSQDVHDETTSQDTAEQSQLNVSRESQPLALQYGSLVHLTPPASGPILNLTSDTHYTYSIHETQLHRRLHRASVERVFRFLSGSSKSSRDDAEKWLRIPLSFQDIDTLRLRARDVLLKGLDEELEAPEYPVDSPGYGSQQSADWLEESDEAVDLSSDTPSHGDAGLQTRYKAFRVRFAGVESSLAAQQWLRPWDVEQYLRTKAIFPRGDVLTTSTSHVEIKLPVWSRNNRAEAREESVACVVCKINAADEGPLDLLQRKLLLSGCDGRCQCGAEDLIDGQNVFTHNGGAAQSISTWASFSLDIDRIVSELVERSFCLGTSPGYAKRDIDAAWSRCLTLLE